ncbi:PTS sugar transporter subunit IIA [Lapidilactobacillus bayanensis]|uniref:PTS sugar transporter subunit IIA n=1 Tax=Lapidilactobacillus bayanensis TaxID=2485998 RepID=UPI0013DD8FB9|nr:glucose PTS transporter subunit IIA [Lapidilactobacillus bayanensis]
MALLKFGFVKKSDQTVIFSPVEGEVVDLIKVHDPALAQKNLGDGFAVEPTDNVIYAPVSGQVTMIATTQHAIGFRMANGLEVLLHLGLNTSMLNGRVFHLRVKHGQKVTGGQRIATANFNRIRAQGFDDTVVVTFPNSEAFSATPNILYGPAFGAQKLGRIHLQQ